GGGALPSAPPPPPAASVPRQSPPGACESPAEAASGAGLASISAGTPPVSTGPSPHAGSGLPVSLALAPCGLRLGAPLVQPRRGTASPAHVSELTRACWSHFAGGAEHQMPDSHQPHARD